MIAAAAHRRVVAIALLVVLAAAPVAVARPAWADSAPPPAVADLGSVLGQVNKGFAILFMIFKLAEIIGPIDFPAQGGPPDPQWGSHPGPLPVTAPPVASAEPVPVVVTDVAP
jgi:hypothetical protein